MTSSDFDSLIRSYGKWLSDNTTYTQLDEWYEVNVPLLDEDNDYTQFYVKPGKNSVTFSDDCDGIAFGSAQRYSESVWY